jgi:hypothetical protein
MTQTRQGVFANLELNKPTNGSASVLLYANATINGTLTFSGSASGNKLINIQSNNLLFSAQATVSGANSARYIQTNGLLGDGGVTKTYSAASPNFTFHVGAPSVKHAGVPNYSPSTISISGTALAYGRIPQQKTAASLTIGRLLPPVLTWVQQPLHKDTPIVRMICLLKPAILQKQDL